MYLLENIIRDYAWGTPNDIAELLGVEPSGDPQAEMWIGAHPASPSIITADGHKTPLSEAIAADPVFWLGEDAAARFGALPFLTKLLSASTPLSLQAHPTKSQAQESFAAEEASGVPLDAPTRNYKDDNHKPEMIVALTGMKALSGFRSPKRTRELLSALNGLVLPQGPAARMLSRMDAALQNPEVSAALEEAFVLALGQEESIAAVQEIAAALGSGEMPPAQWALEMWAFDFISRHYPQDPGALVSTLLNVVELEKGQAIYLPAGNLHAYLQGFGVEVMATSDNVLRGGMTPKHIDIPELKRTLVFEDLEAPYCVPELTESEGVRTELFTPPFEEFSMAHLLFSDDAAASLERRGAAVVLATSGTLTLVQGQERLELAQGSSAIIAAAEPQVRLEGSTGAEAFLITGA